MFSPPLTEDVNARATPLVTPLHKPVVINADGSIEPRHVTLLNNTDASSYRSIIGLLQFLDHTRIDACYSIRQLSRLTRHPTEEANQALKRVLKYLLSTRTWGILVPHPATTSTSSPITSPVASLSISTDASFAVKNDTRSMAASLILYSNGEFHTSILLPGAVAT